MFSKEKKTARIDTTTSIIKQKSMWYQNSTAVGLS
jgi:hypothetical protein